MNIMHSNRSASTSADARSHWSLGPKHLPRGLAVPVQDHADQAHRLRYRPVGLSERESAALDRTITNAGKRLLFAELPR